MPEAPIPAFDPALEGVLLSAYARVVVACSEGFPIELALQHGGVDPRAWPAADQAWSKVLASTAAADAPIIQAFDARTIEARDALSRRLPPIDEELSAWIDFLRGWSTSVDPFGLLDQLGLRANDVLRLQRHWARRMEASEALQIEAAEILGRPPREVQIARPVEAIIAIPAIPAKGQPAPSVIQAARFPRLAAPMPVEEAVPATSARKPNPLAGTSFALDVPLGPALPFAGGSAAPPPPLPPPPPSQAPESALVSRVIAPHKAPPGHTGTTLSLGDSRGPAMPFAARHPLASPPPPTASAQPPPLATTPPAPPPLRAAPPSLAGTSLALDIPRGAAMPFVGGSLPAPSASPPASIVPVPARRAPPPGLAGTSLAVDVPRGNALPFAGAGDEARPTDPAAPIDPQPKKS